MVNELLIKAGPPIVKWGKGPDEIAPGPFHYGTRSVTSVPIIHMVIQRVTCNPFNYVAKTQKSPALKAGQSSCGRQQPIVSPGVV